MLGMIPGPSARVVQFDVMDPVARHVEVTGDFTGWVEHGIQLRQHGIGGWRATLTLQPGEYQYRLRINGVWGNHPEATRRVANPFGSENCVLEVV